MVLGKSQCCTVDNEKLHSTAILLYSNARKRTENSVDAA